MKQCFGFLLFEQFEDLDFFGPWEMIALWSQQFKGPQEVVIISETGKAVTSTKGLTLNTQTDFDGCPKLDFLLIPGGQGTRIEVNNPALIHFIKTKANQCQQILSVCTGAFLLHAAGLLHNKKATTHWASLDRLKAFSDITVIEERFIKDGNIWTSAGISAGTDMALAFIAHTAGETTAGEVQLQAEYYPQTKIYPTNTENLPTYVTR